MTEFCIRDFETRDAKQVLKLHYDTFVNVDGGENEYRASAEKFESLFKLNRVLVAESNSKIVGLATYVFASERNSSRDGVQDAINYSWDMDESVKNHLKNFLEGEQKKYGGDVVVQYFSNGFTQEGKTVQDEDLIFTDLAVDPKFRRRGIGEELARKRINMARKHGSSAIYAQCLGEGGSKLLSKLEFLPIIRAGPRYPDGSACTVMGLQLK
jgi:ribosomal protein S18 acetylase RimI-like enzyme